MKVILLKINQDYKPDDSAGWISAAVYDFYPSKEQIMEQLEVHGIDTDEIILGEHIEFIELQFYET